ncbi:MAG: hypothetical protein HY943_21085 [Gammaproteobacteria bacterium]|nr:hypothetical protein [Gammaproteobacteria bacterium]
MRAQLVKRVAAAEGLQDADQARRLRALLKREPRNVDALPWASLIQGSGYRPKADHPDEERLDALIAALPARLRDVIRVTFGWWATTPQRCELLEISRATYFRRLREARGELARRWRRPGQ